ncbi:DUF86 domain-containing protein [Ilyobacter sp.]|uniref:type VII toxin-antitoxin system HepT family RNase toxin n=1 Tax=Ilyobacter sp. TaxID=3100343 RepID=UPI003564FF8F
MERVVFNKVESIEKCVRKINEIYSEETFEESLYQDALILHIQRACQQSIDLSMYIVSKLGLGIPKKSSEAFTKLVDGKVISKDMGLIMEKMVGFRNVIIHEYQSVDINVLKFIATEGKLDFLKFTREIIEFMKTHN